MSSRRALLVVAACLAVACLAVAAPVGSLRAAPPVRALVAVAAHEGLAGEARLRHAGTDAQRVARVLVELGDVDAEHATVLVDPSPAAVLDAIDRVARRFSETETATDDGALVFYYSGHGDAEDLHLGGRELPRDRLDRALAAVPAGLRVSVVDACRSRGARRRGLRDAAPFVIEVARPPGPRGTLAMWSSSDGEDAQESDELGGGVFTHYLVSGLRGAADVDDDGRVTFDEAYAHAYARTLRRSAASAGTPQHAAREVDVEGAGAVVLTWTAHARSSLALPAAEETAYLVYLLPSGAVMAEVVADPERPTVIALPAGRFLVQRRAPGRYGAAEVALPWGGVSAVAPEDFRSVPLARLEKRGGATFVDRHELHLGYALAGHPDRGLAHGLALRYGFRWDVVALTAGLDLGLTSYGTAVHDVSGRWLGGDLRAELRLPLAPVELRFGAGVALRGVREELERRDAGRLAAAGYPTTSTSDAFGVGPLATLALHVPIAGRWWAVLTGDWRGLFLPQSGGTTFRHAAGGGIALGVTL